MDENENYYSPQISVAPWTEQQIQQLNHRQTLKHLHPYTCGDCGELLIATTHGWACNHCGYSQQWCFVYDLDPYFTDYNPTEKFKQQ